MQDHNHMPFVEQSDNSTIKRMDCLYKSFPQLSFPSTTEIILNGLSVEEFALWHSPALLSEWVVIDSEKKNSLILCILPNYRGIVKQTHYLKL